MQNCLYVGIGGFFGSICRYLVGRIHFHSSLGLPLGTLLINVSGAFVIGIITALAAKQASVDERILLLLKVGFCGGFTTFSTFSLESMQLLQNGKTLAGLLYILLSVTLCLAAIALAEMLLKAI